MAFEVEFSKRLDLFGAEIFAALNDKKVALEAQGKKLYNLSVGTPDFEPMPHIKQALCDAAMVSENWKYSLRDLPELLDTVCAYYKRRFDVDGITPDQIMSFNGSQDGMGHMGLALLNDGDVVLLPDPCYPVFITGVKLGGGVPYYYHLTKEHNFLPNVKEIPDDVADKAKIMIVSLPANPVGSVGSPELYQEIVDFCNAHKILLIHDNAYSDIIFDGAVGHSIFNIPGAETCAVEFFSLSKSFNVTGARISFLVGRRDVIAACKKLRTQIDFGKFIPEQKAAIAAMAGPLEPIKAQCAEYQRRRDVCYRKLMEIPGVVTTEPKGAFYTMAKLPVDNAEDFQMYLLKEFSDHNETVMFAPGSGFYATEGAGLSEIRIAYVRCAEELERALDLLRIAIERYNSK